MFSSQAIYQRSSLVQTPLLHTHKTSTDRLFTELTQSIKTNQWIWFTSQSIRPSVKQLASFHIPVNQVIQLKSSTTLSEFEVATKAIKSGNASALVVSDSMTAQQKNSLKSLGNTYQCKILFTESNTHSYH